MGGLAGSRQFFFFSGQRSRQCVERKADDRYQYGTALSEPRAYRIINADAEILLFFYSPERFHGGSRKHFTGKYIENLILKQKVRASAWATQHQPPLSKKC